LLVDASNWSSHFPPEDQVEILSGLMPSSSRIGLLAPSQAAR
jgi:hypothetical protein